MKSLDRMAASVAQGVTRRAAGTTTSNGLQAPLSRWPLGVSDGTFVSDAKNGYLQSAAVFTGITCWAINYHQFRYVVSKGREPGGEPWPEHPLQRILNNPNFDMSMQDQSIYNILYILTSGSSHLHAFRNGRRKRGLDGLPRDGDIIYLRPFSAEEIKPVPVSGNNAITGESWIDHYVHKAPIFGGYPQRVERENIISLRFAGINPLMPQLSISPFAACALDIQADVELVKFPLDLMKNGVFLSYVFSLVEESKGWADGVFSKIKGEILQQFTGAGNRFQPTVVRGGNKAEAMLPNFRNMEIDKLGMRNVLRILAAARVPLPYSGFGPENLTYDNIKLSRIGFVKNEVYGLAMLHAGALTQAMQREDWSDHPYGSGTSDFTIDVDTSGVLALKDEEIAGRTQATLEWNAGGLTLNEYREEIDQDALDDTDERGGEFKKAAAPVGFLNPADSSTNDGNTKPTENA